MCPAGNDGGGRAGEPPPPDDPLGEIALAWATAVAGVLLAYRILPAAAAPFAAAAIWIGVAAGFHLAHGRRLGPAGFTLGGRPLRAALAAGLYGAVALPLFAAGWLWWQAAQGGPPPSEWRPPGAGAVASAFLWDLAFVALPEEAFFRGYIQQRLADRFPARPRRPLPWVPLTPAVAIGAAIFALTHVAFEPAAERLLTFFPGLLFGALREETGGIAAPALFHALCNAALAALQAGHAG